MNLRDVLHIAAGSFGAMAVHHLRIAGRNWWLRRKGRRFQLTTDYGATLTVECSRRDDALELARQLRDTFL